MVWAKIDDAILDNPKVAKAGVVGFALYVAGITYCCRNVLINTLDGFIPDSAVRRLIDMHDLFREVVEYTQSAASAATVMSELSKDIPQVVCMSVADRLVSCGLWARVDGGYLVHDYAHYNPTKDQAQQVRTVRSASGKAGAKKRWKNGKMHGKRHGKTMANAIANGWQTDGKSDGKTMAKVCPDPDPLKIDLLRRSRKNPIPDPDPSSGALTLIPDEATEPKRRKHKYPETLAPDPTGDPNAWAAWCRQWGFSPTDEQVIEMATYHYGKGTNWRDWRAANRTWRGRERGSGVRKVAWVQPPGGEWQPGETERKADEIP